MLDIDTGEIDLSRIVIEQLVPHEDPAGHAAPALAPSTGAIFLDPTTPSCQVSDLSRVSLPNSEKD